jgi:hypothetical protein
MSSDIDLGEARKALMAACGSVSIAAKALKCQTVELRLVAIEPALVEAAIEAEEQALDEAEAVVRKALRSANAAERLLAAGHLLRTSPAASRRGWGAGKRQSEEEAKPVVIEWRDK